MHRSLRAFSPGASTRGLFLAAAPLATFMPAHADITLREEPGPNKTTPRRRPAGARGTQAEEG